VKSWTEAFHFSQETSLSHTNVPLRERKVWMDGCRKRCWLLLSPYKANYKGGRRRLEWKIKMEASIFIQRVRWRGGSQCYEDLVEAN
jgi:hypothetical protein